MVAVLFYYLLFPEEKIDYFASFSTVMAGKLCSQENSTFPLFLAEAFADPLQQATSSRPSQVKVCHYIIFDYLAILNLL